MSLLLTRADARALPFASGCVQCVVTSPPYWGLRDYGVGGQIGLEATPDAYVADLVAVFREVWRVLRDDGTVWLNLGDSYAGGGGFAPTAPCNVALADGERWGALNPASMARHDAKEKPAHARIAPAGLKAKDLIGLPWRVALALQADGWYLRADIIWHKRSCMPESVTDRPTRNHEYVFLLTKSARYYYDAEAVREPAEQPDRVRADAFGGKAWAERQQHSEGSVFTGSETRNRRSVWTVTTQPYPGAHFATMPEALVEPCILAGSKAGDLVLDPFTGSGTVARVALRFGRRAIGCDLNAEYLTLAQARTRVTLGLPLDEGAA